MPQKLENLEFSTKIKKKPGKTWNFKQFNILSSKILIRHKKSIT